MASRAFRFVRRLGIVLSFACCWNPPADAASPGAPEPIELRVRIDLDPGLESAQALRCRLEERICTLLLERRVRFFRNGSRFRSIRSAERDSASPVLAVRIRAQRLLGAPTGKEGALKSIDSLYFWEVDVERLEWILPTASPGKGGWARTAGSRSSRHVRRGPELEAGLLRDLNRCLGGYLRLHAGSSEPRR